MSKQLEALEHIYYGSQGYGETDKYYEYLKNYLESIDNANPSEALEDLEKIKGMEISAMPFKDDCGIQEVDLNDIRKVGSQLNTEFREYTNTIKQSLIKSQEQEKILSIIKEHLSFKDDSFTYPENNQEKVQLSIVVESKDTECTIHINFKKQEEFELLKRYFK